LQPVRVPGDAAAKSIAEAQKSGISYDVLTWAGLCEWADKLGVDVPVSA
jgi:LDH2 family malate/lactate/ureidoglycolate dehydrogenase